jgi:hypothetical protein
LCDKGRDPRLERNFKKILKGLGSILKRGGEGKRSERTLPFPLFFSPGEGGGSLVSLVQNNKKPPTKTIDTNRPLGPSPLEMSALLS